MRAITGKYKGRRFDLPRHFNGRPTTDFAKENLFNVLRGYVDFEGLHVLDLFSGTGSISLEFLSRGATRVVSVENDVHHFAFQRSLKQKLNDEAWLPLHSEALRYIVRTTERFDLVFADPPYALEELPSLPKLVLEGGLLRSGGFFVLEHGKEHSFTDASMFVEHRAYGSVNFSIFRKESSLPASPCRERALNSLSGEVRGETYSLPTEES